MEPGLSFSCSLSCDAAKVLRQQKINSLERLAKLTDGQTDPEHPQTQPPLSAHPTVTSLAA